MKKIYLTGLISLLLCPLYLQAQDEIKTIAGRDGHNGGFGALSFRTTKFKDKQLAMMGFRGGWIINRSLAIGIEAHGVIPSAEFDDITPLGRTVLLGGYGGLFLEPILFSNEIVHVTFPINTGAGWLGHHLDWEESHPAGVDELASDDVFWYVEPGISAEMNVSRHFRIGVGASRRITQELELLNTSSDDFDTMSYFLTLKWGRF